MRTVTMLLATALGVLLGSVASANIELQAHLTSDQEVPPIVSAASGTGAFTLNDDGTVVFAIHVSNLCDVPLLAHFHEGAPGVSGDIILNLSPSLNGTTTQMLTPDQQQALFAGKVYV